MLAQDHSKPMLSMMNDSELSFKEEEEQPNIYINEGRSVKAASR
jgi:hypothetical protein